MTSSERGMARGMFYAVMQSCHLLQHASHYGFPSSDSVEADVALSGEDPLELAARGDEIEPYVSCSSHQNLHLMLTRAKNSMACYPRTRPA